MALFAYRALTPAGRSCAGLVDADSRTGAWESLRARGIYPTELAEHSTTTGRAAGRVPAVELAGVTRQLALLVQAGVPVADALDAAAEATAHPALLQALTHARAAVREGRPLADAFGESPRVFPPLHCDLVRAGEAAGALGPVLARLAAYTETSAALRARLRAALTYPAVMATATTAVLVFLLAWVLPQMAALFADTGAMLPPATRLLMALGSFAAATWWLWLGVVLAGGVALRTWARTDDGRRAVDGALLRIPVLGRLLAAAALARVTRTLSTLLASGLRLEHALAMAADAAGNRRVAAAVLAAREAVHRGEALAPSLRASPLVPPLVVRLVATGERGGTLPETLDHAATALDAEVERGVAGTTALIEPVLVLLMGAAVLLLVLTVLVPILTLDPLGATR